MKIGGVTVQPVPGDPALVNISNATGGQTFAVSTVTDALDALLAPSSTEAAPEVPAQGASEGLSGVDVRSATVIPPATAAASTSTDLAFCPACEKEWQRDTASSTRRTITVQPIVHNDHEWPRLCADVTGCDAIRWKAADGNFRWMLWAEAVSGKTVEVPSAESAIEPTKEKK